MFKRELEKLKDIALKSVYEKLLDKIKDVNSILQTLTQQALDLQKVKGKKGRTPRRVRITRHERRREKRGETEEKETDEHQLVS